MNQTATLTKEGHMDDKEFKRLPFLVDGAIAEKTHVLREGRDSH